MKKGIFILILTAIILIGLYYVINQRGEQVLGYNFGQPTRQVAPATATPLPVVLAKDAIQASGKLVPAQFMDLGFETGGVVAIILVEEGQQVEKGQVIAQLGNEAELDYEISQAELDVLNAQKALDDLYQNAPMIAAQANYDIVAVEKELEKAVKRRNAMEYGKAIQKDIDTAYRAYKTTEDILKEIDSFSESTNPQAQAAYKAAKKERDNAWAKYNWMTTPYTPKEKAEQDAVVKLNEQKLADLKQKYSLYSKGPDPEEVSIAQARLDLAKNQLELAKMKKTRLDLLAPFSGMVTNLAIKPGKLITAGEPVVTLADISRWHIETDDLTELNVTRIKEGAPAAVKVDALPGKTFNGKVISIKNFGVAKKGDITYTVIIEIENSDERLRWNMTSPITIQTR